MSGAELVCACLCALPAFYPPQSLEAQLQVQQQRVTELEQQVSELTQKLQQLSNTAGAVEAASRQASQLDKQVRVCRAERGQGHTELPLPSELAVAAASLSAHPRSPAMPQVVRLEAALRVASVERQQLQQRLQQLGDEAAAEQREASQDTDALRVQLAARDAVHRWGPERGGSCGCACMSTAAARVLLAGGWVRAHTPRDGCRAACVCCSRRRGLEDAVELQQQVQELQEQLDEATAAKVGEARMRGLVTVALRLCRWLLC
jgi:hypothetical protein